MRTSFVYPITERPIERLGRKRGVQMQTQHAADSSDILDLANDRRAYAFAHGARQHLAGTQLAFLCDQRADPDDLSGEQCDQSDLVVWIAQEFLHVPIGYGKRRPIVDDRLRIVAGGEAAHRLVMDLQKGARLLATHPPYVDHSAFPAKAITTA